MGKLNKPPRVLNGRKILILIVAAIAVVLILAAYLMMLPPAAPAIAAQNQTYDSYENALFRYEINRYPAKAEVSNISGDNLSVGVSIDSWNLNFGIVPTGGSFGRRFMTLKNAKEEPVFIQLRSYGDIAPYVEFSRNDFTLGNKESAPVDILFRTKKDTAVGAYSGEIDITIKQPKYDFLRWFEWLW